ncbi:hypothetical protein IOC51_06650 [Vibrio parahaemolyticus]|uniref:hypothetical protein n=1 Tax=Vibrio parahaemolyticus TaxID=670 RepID=UPI001E62F3FC|nr:hypothetical protein [Vibrio parahaemolyticus]MCD1413714.1 hypothetical protein [Vibrio parahaemolyticus]
MHYFLVISCSDNKEKTEKFLNKVEEVYPIGDSFTIAENAKIIRDAKISIPSMIQKRLFPDEQLSEYGRSLITPLAPNYWGYHGSDLWAWLEEKPSNE